MSSPQAAKEFTKLLDLVEEGELPDTAIPRMFYFGHKLLHGIHEPMRRFKCVECKSEWTLMDDLKSDPPVYSDSTCPVCKTKDNVYDITGDDQLGRWQCLECQHEWTGKDGTVCPKCGAVKEK
jgi:rubrerythrin